MCSSDLEVLERLKYKVTHLLGDKVKVPTQICLSPKHDLFSCAVQIRMQSHVEGRKWDNGCVKKMETGSHFRMSKTKMPWQWLVMKLGKGGGGARQSQSDEAQKTHVGCGVARNEATQEVNQPVGNGKPRRPNFSRLGKLSAAPSAYKLPLPWTYEVCATLRGGVPGCEK